MGQLGAQMSPLEPQVGPFKPLVGPKYPFILLSEKVLFEMVGDELGTSNLFYVFLMANNNF